jgi:Protein of unknown function (DUF3995)
MRDDRLVGRGVAGGLSIAFGIWPDIGAFVIAAFAVHPLAMQPVSRDATMSRRRRPGQSGRCIARFLRRGSGRPKVEMRTPSSSSLKRAWPAYAAAVLAFGSAALSMYWTLGGTRLLDTVGGSLEELARERSSAALALGIFVVLVKVFGGVLALALVRPWGARIGQRLLVVLGAAASALVVLYGGVYVLVGGLVLSGVITPAEPVERHGLRWHVFVWDLWFLLWGLALATATWRSHVDRPSR